ncbi:MAG: S24 family peptidase [Phycisphaerae bacterium]|jgi:phage repressor protein C with HTH and peptisase S24 domain|nr:S24 family peptidase [Phycisphaerae bacterium]
MTSAEPNEQHTRGAHDIPIINHIPAGYPRDFTDMDYPPSVADEYVRCPDIHDPQAFAARVVGDSMEPNYHEGDIVVFAPNTPAESGQDCFVRLDTGETTFKRVYQDDPATLRLQPLNDKHAAHVVSRREVTGLWPAVVRIERLNDR